MVLEGVFATAPDGTTRFDPAPPPTDREVASLLVTIRTRIVRLLPRRGVLAADDASDLATDPLADAAPVLAQLRDGGAGRVQHTRRRRAFPAEIPARGERHFTDSLPKP